MHHENETLFWTKAASVLGLQQQKMHRSQVPYSSTKALDSLRQFCKANNADALQGGCPTKGSIFSCYKSLIAQYQPRFVEKSPHHLYNESNLDLIREFISQFKDEIDFKVIGLVRHPLSVIYSGWDRWKYDCGKFEKEWFISNRNLLDYKQDLAIDLVRYEDLVEENGAFMHRVLGLEPVSDDFAFRRSSLEKWKSDEKFGHTMRDETVKLAEKFGYANFETAEDKLTWKIKDISTYASVELKRFLR
ncbi:sulfotransferase [Pontibacter ummariensis]|nr:sulfotransferase [Pontibacter ummariensis]